MLSFLTPWHRAIFPQGLPYSIFAAVEVNHQVRYGLVWFFYAEDTRILPMNEERFKRKTYWLVIVGLGNLEGTPKALPSFFIHPRDGRAGRAFGFFMLSKSGTIKIDGEYLIELIGSCNVGTRFKSTGLLGYLSCIHHCTST